MKSRPSAIERLEPRRLFALAAAADLTLVSTEPTAGPGGVPLYHYDITLRNTGTTTLGTFWFAWTPGADFLPSRPAASNPAGWTSSIQGENSSTNGSSIEWIASSSGARVAPGASLAGFSFTTIDAPAALAGNSPIHPQTPALTSTVYSAIPFSDSGFQFTAAAPNSTNSSTGSNLAAVTFALPSKPKLTTFPLGAASKLQASLSSSDKSAFTGDVQLTEGDEILATGTLSPTGQLTFPISDIPGGPHTVQIVYPGDTKHAAATSDAFTLSISRAPVTSKLQLSSAKVAAGQPITLTANILTKPNLPFSPTGIITFKDGDTSIGTPVSNSPTASLTIQNLSAGTHHFSATFAGDTNFLPSKPAAKTLTAPKTTLRVTPTPKQNSQVTANTDISFSFAPLLPISSGVPAPTALATLVTPSGTLTSPINSNGIATFAVNFPNFGKQRVTLSLASDDFYNAIKPQTLTYTVR